MNISKKTSALVVVACMLTTPSMMAHAFKLGGGSSGKKFNYEACGKIVEGKTTVDEAKKMLGGKPVGSGKEQGYSFLAYSHTKKSGLRASLGGIGAGKSKQVRKECTLLYGADNIIINVSMNDSEGGGSDAGL